MERVRGAALCVVPECCFGEARNKFLSKGSHSHIVSPAKSEPTSTPPPGPTPCRCSCCSQTVCAERDSCTACRAVPSAPHAAQSQIGKERSEAGGSSDREAL